MTVCPMCEAVKPVDQTYCRPCRNIRKESGWAEKRMVDSLRAGKKFWLVHQPGFNQNLAR